MKKRLFLTFFIIVISLVFFSKISLCYDDCGADCELMTVFPPLCYNNCPSVTVNGNKCCWSPTCNLFGGSVTNWCDCDYSGHIDYSKPSCNSKVVGNTCYYDGESVCKVGGWDCNYKKDTTKPSCYSYCVGDCSNGCIWYGDPHHVCDNDVGWTCEHDTIKVCTGTGQCCSPKCDDSTGCGHYLDNSKCPNGICMDNCQCCTNECTKGAKRCNGAVIQECRTDGDDDPCTEWVNIKNCKSDCWWSGCDKYCRSGCSESGGPHCTGSKWSGCRGSSHKCGTYDPPDVCGANVLKKYDPCTKHCSGGSSDSKCYCKSCTPTEHVYVCDNTHHNECQAVTCGGKTYYCTNYGGTPGTTGEWKWRTSDLCQDGICKYCSGGTCKYQTSDNGRNCQDDCTKCENGNCVNRPQCDNTECSGQAKCDADGGNCVDPDKNSHSGEIVCEICYGKEHNFTETWKFGSGTHPYCCGDDQNEYFVNSTYTNRSGVYVNTFACCDDSTDCTYEENGVLTCFDSGTSYDVDGDGDTDYCNAGQWLDCWTDDNCKVCWECDLSTHSCTPQTGWDGHGCVDDCTKCENGNCVNRPKCDTTECRAVGWVHYYSDQAACNADGGDCADPDDNTAGGAAVCEGPLPGCWASNHSYAFSGSLWNFENVGLQSPECCGDDPNEFLITFKNATGMKPIPGSDNWKACCDNSTDCVIDSSRVGGAGGVKCYDSLGPESCQHDIDGDGHVDYCNNGVWMPCEANYTIRITGPYGIADELYGASLPPEAFLPP